MTHVNSLTGKPVKNVLSTHYHADHSGGNSKFLPTAEIISTANARDAIVEHKQSNAPPGVAPAHVVFTQEAGVFLAGKFLQLIESPDSAEDSSSDEGDIQATNQSRRTDDLLNMS